MQRSAMWCHGSIPYILFPCACLPTDPNYQPTFPTVFLFFFCSMNHSDHINTGKQKNNLLPCKLWLLTLSHTTNLCCFCLSLELWFPHIRRWLSPGSIIYSESHCSTLAHMERALVGPAYGVKHFSLGFVTLWLTHKTGYERCSDR